jgi:N12 class adenine-specific DNA methylase
MSGFDIIPDGKPVEDPEAAADIAYQDIPSTAGESIGEQVGSTLRSAGRVATQGLYRGSGILPQMLYGMTREQEEAAAPFGTTDQMPPPGSEPTPMLPHEEYQQRYAPLGNDGKPVSLGDGPLPEAVAKLIGEAKREEIERDNVTARFENAHSWPTNFAVGSLGFMLDPLRAATIFVPGIGEEAIMARTGAGIIGRTVARLGAGAASGALAMAPVAALQYGLGQEEASDYGLREALLDTAMGAGLAALTHAGITGPIKDLWHVARAPAPPPAPPGGGAPPGGAPPGGAPPPPPSGAPPPIVAAVRQPVIPAGTGPVADLVRENVARSYATATRLNIVGNIEGLAAEGKTASQIAEALGPRLDQVRAVARANGDSERQAAAQFVREARIALGIPSMDNMTEFNAWKNARQGAPATTPPAPEPAPPARSFRTTIEINGQRTVIESNDVADFERQAAEWRASMTAGGPPLPAAETVPLTPEQEQVKAYLLAQGHSEKVSTEMAIRRSPAAESTTTRMWQPDAEAQEIGEKRGIPTRGVTEEEFFEEYARQSGVESIGGQIPFFHNPENEAAFIAAQERLGITFEDEIRKAAAAAPIVHADAQTQHAAISASVAELADGRPVDTEAFFPTPDGRAPTPAEIAAKQAEMRRDGFVAGVPPEELREATAEIYGPPEPEAEAAKPPPPPAPPEPPEGEAEGKAKAPPKPKAPTPQVMEPPAGTKYVLPSFVTGAAVRAPRPEPKEIGKNSLGQTLYEDERGVRSTVENGVRTTEPVGMTPTRDGVKLSIDRDAHPEYKIAPEGVTPRYEYADFEDPGKRSANKWAVDALNGEVTPQQAVAGLARLVKEGAIPEGVAQVNLSRIQRLTDLTEGEWEIALASPEHPGLAAIPTSEPADIARREQDRINTLEQELREREVGPSEKATIERAIAEARRRIADAGPLASEKAGYGESNKIFTKDAADKARAILRAKLGGSQLNAGFDPEIAAAGLTLAGYHIEAGAHKFADFAHEMVADFGEAIRPYLRGFYENARHYPDFEPARNMSTPEEIDRAIEDAANATQHPGTLRTGGNGEGTEDGGGAATRGPVATAPEGSEQPGAGTAEPNPAGEPGPGSSGEGAGAGAGIRHPDNIPAGGEAGPGSPGVTGRPAGERNGEPGERAPDADVKGANYVIEPGALAEARSPRVKANDNIAAIELAKSLTAAGLPATKEQQAILARYVGWGGLSGALPDAKGNFRGGLDKIGARLKEILTDDEHRAAAASVLNAHYTSEVVVRSMWQAVERLGFKGGSVFEPGMGIGNFLGLMPGDLAAASRYQGIERDAITAQIAKLLYPESGVRQGDFSRVKVPLDHFDMAIGNPPFGNIAIKADPRYAARNFSIHNFFFAKSIDSVRPGGLLAFITSHFTMDSMDGDARRFLAERAEFLGAVRLPNTAFKANAGTEVTTDILFFKKRAAPVDLGNELPEWTQSALRELPDKNGEPATGPVNRYFTEHPEMVLGNESFAGKMNSGRDEYTVGETPGTVLSDRLREAMARLPEGVMDPPLSPEEKAAIDFSSTEKVDGSYYVAPDGRLMQYSQGAGRPVPERGAGVEGGKTAAEIHLIRDFVPLRDAMREVYRANLAGDEVAGAAARAQLGRVYDAFVAKNGPVNKTEFTYRRPNVVQQENARTAAREEARAAGEHFDEGDFDPGVMIAMGSKANEIARARETARGLAKEAGREFDEGTFDPAGMPDIETRKQPNLDPLRADQQSYVLSAAEDYDAETGLAEKRRIFFENNLTRYIEPELKSANDGVMWSMNKHGRLDVDAIAKKLGVTRPQVIEELGDAVMRLPGTQDSYVIRDAYLSGDVVTKLEEARAAVEADPRLQRNVSALEAVQPPPLPPGEITMNLGMSWIPVSHILNFLDDIGMGRTNLQFSEILGQWLVDKDGKYGPRQAEWSTERLGAHELLELALNGKSAVIRDRDPGPPTTTYVNQEATEAAQEVVSKLKEAFTDWTMADPARAVDLATLYNAKFNRVVLRQWDGGYLTTPGVSSNWSWRPHQTRVVARIIQDGNTYMAHAVGAGKTSAMIGSAMEMRRLGLVAKPMFVVPNHMLGQFAKEFYEQYPTARIMVADTSNFHTSVRKQFVANIAQQDLDGVVITNSAFGLIPISGEFSAQMIREATDEIDEAFAQLGQNPDELKKVTKGVNPDDRFTVKRLQAQKQRLEQKLLAARARQDEVNTFEELGVDFLFVDEAHQFRKLPITTITPMKGIDSSGGSDMAWDLYTKSRYLDQQNPGRSLVMASGTPVTNTMGELYSISRYIQPKALAERGLQHFDAWKQAFGTTTTKLEPTVTNEYKNATRFDTFVNMPELYKMVGSAMDVVTSKDLAQYVTRPAYNRLPPWLAPLTNWLQDFRADITRRAEAIKTRKGPPGKGDDILFSILSDGRKAAIDPRLVDMHAATAGDPSKLNMMIANVHRIWDETRDTQFYDPATDFKNESFRGPATQLVFANSGIGTRNSKGEPVFSSYQWMRREWIRMGIPASEIAFIKDFENPVAKLRLFNDVNEGKVRLLVGSVQKMGTGVNVQRRLRAIHNLDPLWYPADDEQRNGRGFRQGNHNPTLDIHDYSTMGSLDEFMWNLMAKKAGFIEQFFRGDPNLREMEDLGEADTYSQLAAMTTSDPRVMQLAQFKQDLKKLERRQSAHRSEQYRYQIDSQRGATEAAKEHATAAALQEAIGRSHQITGENFKVTVGDQVLTTREEAVAAIDKAVAATYPGLDVGKTQQIGEIGGFPLLISAQNHYALDAEGHFVKGPTGLLVTLKDDAPHFYLQFWPGEDRPLGMVPAPNMIASASSLLRLLPDYLKGAQERARNAELRAESSNREIGKTFVDEAKIPPMRQQVAALEASLSGKQAPVAEDAPPGPQAAAAAPAAAGGTAPLAPGQTTSIGPEGTMVSRDPALLRLWGQEPDLTAALQRLDTIGDQLLPEEQAAIDAAKARTGDAVDEAAACIGESEV